MRYNGIKARVTGQSSEGVMPMSVADTISLVTLVVAAMTFGFIIGKAIKK